ncbi:unnamed protein product [Adineta steineri]|uniref:Uncharacterized protein n=1 Tax=Adineta steineri TaxID=433720 RepID=A0A814XY57_9BILA|nr:unnamed protein product [Adineta steineri]CAF1514131.1 unnamed protein product [Adineta steineri]
MSSNNQQAPLPPSNYGSAQWQTDPFGLAPTANANSGDNGAGNGQQSSYKEQTYTLPGGKTTYMEWTG